MLKTYLAHLRVAKTGLTWRARNYRRLDFIDTQETAEDYTTLAHQRQQKTRITLNAEDLLCTPESAEDWTYMAHLQKTGLSVLSRPTEDRTYLAHRRLQRTGLTWHTGDYR